MQNIFEKLLTKLLTRYPLFAKLFSSGLDIREREDFCFSIPEKKISDSVVALVTTAGVHLKNAPPFALGIKDGDTSYRVIPADSENKDMMITHNHYDHKDADKDINVVFPLEILREFAKEGLIKRVAPRNFGFMGSIYDTGKLVNGPAREVASILKEDGVDVVLLSPA